MQLEASGRPTIVVTTTEFAGLTAYAADQYGLPDVRAVIVGHPIGGRDEATIIRWADEAVEDALAAFTGRFPGLVAPPGADRPGDVALVTSVALSSAIDQLRVLLQADGGDLSVTSVTDTVLEVRLIIEGVSCAECVMPRAFLEKVALGIVQRSVPEIVSVVVDDPREHSNWVTPEHL